MSKKKQRNWPNVYQRIHPAGTISWVVDLGELGGKRVRQSYKTKEEAAAFAEQARIKKFNEGLEAFSLPTSVREDASEAFKLLKPHNITLKEAAKYYLQHVIAYQDAPRVDEIVRQMLSDAVVNQRRERTIQDLRARLQSFADEFPQSRLSEINIEDIKDWIGDHDWAPRTRINYLTKLSQLYNYAIRHGWAEKNIADLIERPEVEDEEPGIFSVDQAHALLEHSLHFGLRGFIALGLFAGLRSAELMRLEGRAIKVGEKAIIVGPEVAKKRSRRVVEMSDALLAWVEGVLPLDGPIVNKKTFREDMDELKTAAGIKYWPHNALRHSFGSYHLAFFGDQIKTAQQMGHRDAGVVHNHYKALVLKTEAVKYWMMRPNAKT